MARTLDGLALLGRIVYRYGSPSMIGRIVRVVDDKTVYVFMIRTNEIKSMSTLMLRDFESLVEEHERKGKEQRRLLEAARVAILPTPKETK